MVDFHKFMAGFLTITLLAGCSLMPPEYENVLNDFPSIWQEDGDAQLREQSNKFNGNLYSQALLGALIGAVIGAGIGAAAAGGKGAAIGAAAGATAGATAGAANAHMQNNREKDAQKVKAAEQSIEILKQENQQLKKFIKKVKNTINADKKKYKKIQKYKSQNEVEKKQAEEEIKRFIGNKKILQKTLTNLRSRKEEAEKVAETNLTLNPEIIKYQKQIEDLSKEIENIPEYDISAAA